MKITIKTNLIKIEIDDEITLHNGYTRRELPELPACLKSAIDEAIRLHNEVCIKKK